LARRSMSILDLEAWLRTTGRGLVGARLVNAYQQGETLLLRFKSPGREWLIVAEPGRRIHATRRAQRETSKQTPLLALVKKHLRGRRLESAGRLGGDRIALLGFPGGYRLVVELVPRGVAALLDPQGVVMAATRYLQVRDRSVRPKQPYTPPPPPARSPLEPPEPRELGELLGGQRDLVRGLVRALGLPGEAAEEAVYRAGLEPGASPGSLAGGDLEALAAAVREVVEESMEGRGYLARGGGVAEATPFRPRRLEARGDVEVRVYESLDEALDEHFHLLSQAPASAGVEGERAKLEASLRRARETAEEYRRRAREIRGLAEAVAARYHELSRVVECVEERRRSGGWSAARGCPGVSGVDPGRGVYTVSLPGLPAPVEVRAGETVDRLIVRLYQEAGEAEAKARRAEEALRQAEERLAELELRARARRAAELARARRREWYERFHWLITRGGLLAIGGRDAGQNESIVRRYLEDGDVFMHADIHGAPAVVVKTGGSKPSEADLLDAAVLAAAYSKAWRSGLGSVGVYWVEGRQVSKSPPSGEYLARGAFMVYGRKNYLPPVRLRLALGLAVDPEGAPMVIVGPEDLVEGRSLAYVVLEPGDMSVSRAAEAVREALARALPRREAHLALGLPLEEIAQRLPGPSRIVAVKRGRARLET